MWQSATEPDEFHWGAHKTPAGELQQVTFSLFVGFGAAGVVPEAWKWPRHAEGSILTPWRPFWSHFGPFLMIEGQTALRLEHCDIARIETSETSTLCVKRRQMSVLATEEMSAVETGQMSAAGTGQMSAVETRQMSSAETRQM